MRFSTPPLPSSGECLTACFWRGGAERAVADTRFGPFAHVWPHTGVVALHAKHDAWNEPRAAGTAADLRHVNIAVLGPLPAPAPAVYCGATVAGTACPFALGAEKTPLL
jgi:hypothetical protein